MSAEKLTDEDLKTILTNAKTVAVVGISTNPSKDSNGVAAYLKKNGYRILLVGPIHPPYNGMSVVTIQNLAL